MPQFSSVDATRAAATFIRAMSLFARLTQRAPAPAGEDGVPVPAAANGGGDAGVANIAVPPIHRRNSSGRNGISGAAIDRNNAGSKTTDIDAASGVLLKTLKPGDVTNYPKRGDVCTIHYEAFTEDEMIRNDGRSGRRPDPFDSSRRRNQVFQFRLGGGSVIEGMDAAVSKMSLGQEVEATIPYPYAYGVAGYPPVVPPRTTLVFRIELIRFSSVV